MELIDENSFHAACGKMIPVRRNMSTFDGEQFKCACGSEHTFYKEKIVVLTEDMNGRFVFLCPNNDAFMSLIKTKMKWG